MKKIYNNILFDWDGCLADTLSIWLEGYKNLFEEYNIKISEKEIVNRVFGSWNGPANEGVKNNKEFMDRLLIKVNKKLSKISLHQNAKQVLKYFKTQGKKIAIVTSSKKDSVYPAFKYHGILELVDIYLTAESVKKHKPDPEIIEKTLKNFNGTIDETIIIGDSDKDVYAGQNANIDSVIFYPTPNHHIYTKKKLTQLNPTYFIEDLLDLKKIIK